MLQLREGGSAGAALTKSEAYQELVMSSPTSSETSTLKIGDPAPDFTLPNANNEKVSLSSYQGKQNVVLAFFPFAFSSVCSAQLPSYEADLERFRSYDTEVIGVSADSRYALAAWAKQYQMTLPLLSDFYPHGSVAEQYGVLHASGRPERALFVIDKAGKIRWIQVNQPGQLPDNEQLFDELRAL
jgi:peroxiredoxin (alkyl hydroperoxide reductase subunit C)